MFTPLCPHLHKFLIERGLYWRFTINVILGVSSFKEYIFVRKSLSITKPWAISEAFDWNNSAEGYSFWESVNRKWEIHYAFLLSGNVIEPYDPKK